MAGLAVLDLLTPSVVTKIVSTVRQPGSVLSRHFGFGIGGANTYAVQGRTYTYDVFDHSRAVARGRAPGAPSGAIAPNAVGNVTVSLAKSAEKIRMDYNQLLQIRAIGENAGSLDRSGKRYVEKQAKYLRQRHDNFREFITAGVFARGGTYGFYRSGEDLIPTWGTSPDIAVDHQIPAGNKLIGGSFAAGLALGTGSNTITSTWATVTNDIGAQLLAVQSGFTAQVGEPMRLCILNSKTWNYVIQNNFIRQLAGTSNQPFASYDNLGMSNPDGTDAGVFRAVLKGLPQFEWLIVDTVINVATTNATTFADTKVVPDDYVVFSAAIDNSWIQMVEGSEFVKDNDLAPAVEREGFYAWIMEKADPARFELHATQTVGMEVNVPKALAVARVA